jgi:hypothetical protein
MLAMRLVTAVVLLSSFWVSCATHRQPAETSRPFSLVGYEEYQEEFLPIHADSGGELVHRFCSSPPPGCEPNSIACSIHPEFPGADWRYRYDVVRVARYPGSPAGIVPYRVRAIALYPRSPRSYVFSPEKSGRVVMWRNIAGDRRERQLVWEYLVRESGSAVARTRLEYFGKMADEIEWHEQQHVREGIRFNRELMRIMNTPAGYPKRLLLRPGQRPEKVLGPVVQRDRERRIAELLQRSASCADKFHAREDRSDSFATLVSQCACFGGWACQVKLPAFPPPDFRCEEGSGIGRRRQASGAFESVHQLKEAHHSHEDSAR